jgi:hypothetical protein
MMVLELRCTNGHFFEGWFANSEAFSHQKEASAIHCPVCDDNRIIQVLSPVAIRKNDRPSVVEESPKSGVEQLKDFYEYLKNNFEEVGTDFAKEALKIHYGVSEKRNIRGCSTADEEKTLIEEGVEFFKIPVPKPKEDE